MITDKVLRQRVQRGLTWIVEEGDRFGVDLDRVDVDTLDLVNSDMCVVGQGTGRGCGGYGDVAVALHCRDIDIFQLGFDLACTCRGCSGGHWSPKSCAWGRLTKIWREAILEHRASLQVMNDELEIALIEGVKV